MFSSGRRVRLNFLDSAASDRSLASSIGKYHISPMIVRTISRAFPVLLAWSSIGLTVETLFTPHPISMVAAWMLFVLTIGVALWTRAVLKRTNAR
jgi:hypothetical protein